MKDPDYLYEVRRDEELDRRLNEGLPTRVGPPLEKENENHG